MFALHDIDNQFAGDVRIRDHRDQSPLELDANSVEVRRQPIEGRARLRIPGGRTLGPALRNGGE